MVVVSALLLPATSENKVPKRRKHICDFDGNTKRDDDLGIYGSSNDEDAKGVATTVSIYPGCEDD